MKLNSKEHELNVSRNALTKVKACVLTATRQFS